MLYKYKYIIRCIHMGALFDKKLGHIQRIAICSIMKRSPVILIIINNHHVKIECMLIIIHSIKYINISEYILKLMIL